MFLSQTSESGIVSMRTEDILHNSTTSTNVDEFDASTIDQPSEETLDEQPNIGSILNLENNDTTPLKQMTFRLRNKRVEAEQVTNFWAGQCQSKVGLKE